MLLVRLQTALVHPCKKVVQCVGGVDGWWIGWMDNKFVYLPATMAGLDK
jgi:hypothetical protein